MNRIAILFAIAATLVIAAPAQAEPSPPNEVNLASLGVVENELYAEARVTRDQMTALHKDGALGTEQGRKKMEELRTHLTQVQAQVAATKGARKQLIAKKRVERVRRTRSMIAVREGSLRETPPRNARR